MPITVQDQVIAAVTIWRENRGGGEPGMHSVMNVVVNSAAKYRRSWWDECTFPYRYSSMTAKGDPELTLFARDAKPDPTWALALSVASQAANGVLSDITNRATLYYNPVALVDPHQIQLPNGSWVKFPNDWNPKVVTYTGEIAEQLFFKE